MSFAVALPRLAGASESVWGEFEQVPWIAFSYF